MSITETDRPASKLMQDIAGPLLYVFILGDVLGAGIYALTGVLAQEVGGAVWVPLAVALGLVVVVGALVIGRHGGDHDHFRMWSPIPVLGVASCLLLLTRQDLVVWLYALGLLSVGVVLHLATRSRSRAADHQETRS